MKLNYFSNSTIHNGMILDCCQLDRALPAIVLMLNMCSFPEQLFKNVQRKSICSTTATYGSMLSNVPLLLLVSMDAICNFFPLQMQLFMYSSEAKIKHASINKHEYLVDFLLFLLTQAKF